MPSPLPDRVLFGAAYYHEYQPHDRPRSLKEDLDQMVEAGFTVIRVGESVWSTWEPENGRFELDWLQPVLDGAHERGISVVLGTPTYAVPPWLARLYPEIAGESATGRREGWGARQEVDITHPAFRFHAERVVRRITARHAGHPAVVGYQVDNEPGAHLLHNEGVFQRFVDDLRQRYGTVEALNEAWGLVYWSHRLSTWADLWRPDGNWQPQYDLAWRRFQGRQITEFIGWQADIVREYAREDQFVTTCLSYDREPLDPDAVAARLDVTSGNPYYVMQDGLALPDVTAEAPQHWTTNGVWALRMSADRMYSSRQEPFLVTETNAQAIGGPHNNQPAYDGQWRQAAWALVARGAGMVEYWHWHTLHYGCETYWGGVLPHSGRPGRTYAEIGRIGGELKRAGGLVAGLTPDADVTFLHSAASRWALTGAPQLALGPDRPDPRSYEGFFAPFFRGAFDAGLQARLLNTGQLGSGAQESASRHPLLVVPGLYVADDATLDALVAYAEAGGHLVLGPRTGYADEEARARTCVQPGRLAEAAGVRYDEFSNLGAPVPVRAADGSPLALTGGEGAGAATRWADGLQPAEGTQVLAAYEHPHFGRWPAAVTRACGRGRITTVGTLPDPAFGLALFDWLVPASRGTWRHAASHPSVTVTGASARDGSRLRFVHNWSWDRVTLELPTAARDVLADGGTPGAAAPLAPGDRLELGPWDVRVLVEE